MRPIFCLMLVSLPLAIRAQTAAATKPDSAMAIVCRLTKADQQYRGKATQDSIAAATKRNDTALTNHFYQTFQAQDSTNFAVLKDVIVKYGYPKVKRNDSIGCNAQILLIHWAKEYPGQFSDPELVQIFKREIDKGTLSKYALDMALYFYVSYVRPTDLQYYELINKARTVYGLTVYTHDEYLGKARIDFDLNKLNADNN